MDEITIVKNKVKYSGWIAMVEACQNSGLSVRTWCQENDIGYKTYYYRLRKLRKLFLEEHKQELIPEITPLPVVAPHQQENISSTTVTLHFEGMSIDIPEGTSEKTITSILLAVKTAW